MYMEELKQLVGIVVVPIVFISIVIAIYIFAGLVAYLASDPMDLFEDGPIISFDGPIYTDAQRQWDNCVISTSHIFDNFNDTVGASYALGDTPATEAQNFMKLCLERRQ